MSDEELTAEWRSLAKQERERANILADIVEKQGRCTNCGKLFTARACGFSHLTVQGLLGKRDD